MLLFVLFASFALLVDFAQGESKCNKYETVTRTAWGSTVPLPTETMHASRRVIIHHTPYHECNTTQDCSATLRRMQNTDINVLDLKDISFQFLIGGDGKVYEGLSWTTPGAHTTEYPKSIGVAFLGNYEDHLPSKTMLEAARDLILCGKERGYLNENVAVYGHKDATCHTNCPGEALYKSVKKWPLYGKVKLYKDCD